MHRQGAWEAPITPVSFLAAGMAGCLGCLRHGVRAARRSSGRTDSSPPPLVGRMMDEPVSSATPDGPGLAARESHEQPAGPRGSRCRLASDSMPLPRRMKTRAGPARGKAIGDARGPRSGSSKRGRSGRDSATLPHGTEDLPCPSLDVVPPQGIAEHVAAVEQGSKKRGGPSNATRRQVPSWWGGRIC